MLVKGDPDIFKMEMRTLAITNDCVRDNNFDLVVTLNLNHWPKSVIQQSICRTLEGQPYGTVMEIVFNMFCMAIANLRNLVALFKAFNDVFSFVYLDEHTGH